LRYNHLDIEAQQALLKAHTAKTGEATNENAMLKRAAKELGYANKYNANGTLKEKD